MLDEANKKRMAEEKANWVQEQDRSQKLEAELKAEKERLKQKREEEKIAARRVIIENEEEKRRRLEKQEELKREEALSIQKAMQAALDKERRRPEEIKQRDEKIQKIMTRMGDVIQGDKDKELQR
jgi:hypothetical protein